jgi:hypothetical protein
MDQKTPPSPDSEKPKEDVTGPTGDAHSSDDHKSWDVSPSSDNTTSNDTGSSDKPADDSSDSSSPDDTSTVDDKPEAGDAAGKDGDDKVAMAGDSWKVDDPDSDATSAKPDDDKPSDSVAVPAATPTTDTDTDSGIPAAIPPSSVIAKPAAPAPAAPAWPASTPGAVMPASAIGGAHKPANKKKLLVALIIAVVIVVLGGGVAAAYFGYVAPNKPENVLKTALMNTFDSQKVKSEHFNGKLSMKDKESNMTMAATFTGGANSDGAFEVKADVDAVVTKLTLDARSTDGKTLYLKVGGLEGLPELLNAYDDTATPEDAAIAKAMTPVIASLNNQWVEINQSILSQFGIDADTSTKLSQADLNKLADAYAKHQFLSVQEKLASEKISDMDSYHYKVAVDKTELKAFVTAVKDAKIDSLKVTQDNVTDFNNMVKDVDFSKYPLDVWITKDTKFIDQVTFTYGDKESTVNARLTVVDYNKPVTVVKPTGAKSILEVISELYTGTAGKDDILTQLEGSGISL